MYRTGIISIIKNLLSVGKSSRYFVSDQVDSNREFLFLKSDYKIKRINFNDILYIEGLKDYMKVYTQSSPKPVMSRSRIVFGKTYIPVSDQYKEKFQEFLDKNFL